MAMGLQGAAYGAIRAVTAGYIEGIKSGAVRASLHGITRSAISKAQGGKWSAGFWSGFASSALAPMASSASTFEGKVAMNAIVGGTASELGGGKFANGAVTGAFIMMFNELGHQSNYDKLEERVANEAKDPKAIINLSNDDLYTIAHQMKMDALSSDKSYLGAMGRNADTFLRHYGGRTFSALGMEWSAGHINYIGVGAYNTVYRTEFGAMLLNPIVNIGWNTGQYINSWFSSSDMGDIPSNLFWMNYGSTHG